MNFGRPALVLFMLFAGMNLTGPNPLLGFMSASVLGLVVGLLWRSDVSPVFVVVCAMQWLQVSVQLLFCQVTGSPVEQSGAYGGDVGMAIALSLMSVVALAIGFRSGLGAASSLSAREVVREVTARPEFHWPRAYALMLGVALLTQSALLHGNPGLTQILFAIAGLKWAYFFIFTVAASQSRGSVRWLWLMAFAFELALGSVGFLSNFRTALFYALMGYMAAGAQINGRRLVGMTAGVTTIVLLGMVWTAIKTEQRAYYVTAISEGGVTSGFGSRFGNTLSLVAKVDGEMLGGAARALMERVSYVDFFARVLDVVPGEVPHEGGVLWMDAVVRPFTPRLLFPGKSNIDDSVSTRKYTGLNIAGSEAATTITIGYPAESYVDFGPWLMMFPIGVLGWGLGRFYRWMVNYRYSRGIVGEALATAVVFQSLFLETSLAKLIGGQVLAILISWIMARWVLSTVSALR